MRHTQGLTAQLILLIRMSFMRRLDIFLRLGFCSCEWQVKPVCIYMKNGLMLQKVLRVNQRRL